MHLNMNSNSLSQGISPDFSLMTQDIKNLIPIELGGSIGRRKRGGKPCSRGDPPAHQLHVTRMSPLTVLLINPYETHGRPRSPFLHYRLPA